MYTGCWSPLGIKYRARSLVQLSGKKQQPSTIGTSLGASVSDTSVWHLMQLEAAKILRLGRSGERVNVLACRIWSLRVFSRKLRTVMFLIMRRRSGLMGCALIGVLLS